MSDNSLTLHKITLHNYDDVVILSKQIVNACQTGNKHNAMFLLTLYVHQNCENCNISQSQKWD